MTDYVAKFNLEEEKINAIFKIDVLPDKVSQLENDLHFQTDEEVAASIQAESDIINSRIDSVEGALSDSINAVDDKFDSITGALDNKIDSINGALSDSIVAVDNKYDSITGGLDDKIDSVEGALIDSITAVDGKYDTITSNLSDSITTLSDTLEAYNTALNDRIDTLAGAVSDLDSTVSSNYTTLNDKIDSINGALSDSINALDSIVSNNFTTLSDSITALDSVVSSNFTTLSDSIVALDSVVSSNYTTLDNKIDSVSGALTDSINALDSVVSSNYTTLDDKIDSISGALSDSISAIDSIISGYGDIVTYNAADFADSAQGALADTALQPNDNISELINDVGYITSAALPTVNNSSIVFQKNGTGFDTITLNQVSDDTINISVPTQASDVSALPDSTTINDLTTTAQQNALNSGATSTNIGQIATNTQAISDETTARENADIGLQQQIDAIVSSSDVYDIVGTYAELQAYDISTVPVNDIIKVLVDSTHDDAATYYRCTESGGVKSWTYIGSEGAYYTKGEADSTFVPQTRTINNKALSSNITLDASDVGALPDSTVIPAAQVNSDWNAVSGVAEILNKPTIPTDTSDLTNGAGYITSAALSSYVDLSSDQNITGTKTFVGQKKIGFKQSSSSDKLGFTLYNNSGTEKGYLEYNPSNTVDSVPLMTLGNYASASGGLTHVGFRKYSSISGASGAYNLLTPLISDAKTPFNLTTTYTNFYLPLGFTDGNTTVLTAKSGVVDLSSLLPTVPTNISAFTNDSGYITSSALNGYATETWVTNKGYAVASSLATVATSGSYNDLTNKPTIPAAQIQSDWNQTNTSAVDYIKNKPTIPSGVIVDQVYDSTSTNAQSGVAIEGELSTNYQSKLVSGTNIKTVNNTSILGSGNISVGTVTSVNNVAPISGNVSLTIPTVNNSTITIQKNSATVDTFTLNQSTAKTINITVPTDTGDLTNGAGFITGITSAMVTGALGYTPYNSTNPSGYQANVIETVKVNGTALTPSSKAVDITVPTNNNQLTNGAGYITSSALSGYAKTADLATVATSGSYNDLSNKPTIPTVNNATLTIQKNGTTVKTFTANASSDVTCNITVPTNTNELTNGAGFVTTDTKNTAGSTDTSSKIFLVGATSQAANPQTYSHDTAFVDTSGQLNSANPSANTNSTVVATTKWVTDKGYTSNSGTITGIKMNGVSKGTSGVVDLGTVITDISSKQDTLVSGTNIKTINNTSILGSGNINISGGSGADTDLSNLSATGKAVIDGQWVASYQGIISSNTSLNGSTALTKRIDLPNDGNDYEVLLRGIVITGASTGNFAYLICNGTNSLITSGTYITGCTTRANSSVYSVGSGIITAKYVASTGTNLSITRNTGYNGNCSELTVIAYRRIGTNS